MSAKYYNAKARERTFKEGDEVLLLLSDTHDNLAMRWRGSYQVFRCRGANDYEINVDGCTRAYHAKKMKTNQYSEGSATPTAISLSAAVIAEETDEVPTPETSVSASSPVIYPGLTTERKNDV